MRAILVLVLALATTTAAAAPPQQAARDTAEAGWRAYLAHDLDRAESLSRDAISHATDPAIRGAALYNLGRVLEDRHDARGAVVSYTESLTARPNHVVRERLAALDPAAAERFEAFAPEATIGPARSLVELCHQVSTARGRPSAVDCDRDPDNSGVVSIYDAPASALPAPFEAMSIVDLGYMRPRAVAVKVGGSWYATAYDQLGDTHCDRGTLAVEDLASHAAATLAITVVGTGPCANKNTSWTWDERSVIELGVGASGRPSATTIRTHASGMPAEYALAIAWSRDGSFDLEILARRYSAIDLETYAGHHAVVFP